MGCDNLATKSDIASLKSEISSLKSQISELKGQLNEINSGISKIINAISTLQNALNQKLSAIASQITNVYTALQNLASTVKSGISQILSAIAKIKCEVDYSRIEGFHRTTRSEIAGIIARYITPIERQISALASQVTNVYSAISSGVSQILAAIARIKCEVDYSRIEGFHRTTRAEIAGIIARYIVPIERQIQAISAQCVNIFNAIRGIKCPDLSGLLVQINNKLTGIEIKLNGIVAGLAGLVAAIVAAISKIKLNINPEFELEIENLIGSLSLKLDLIIGKIKLEISPVLTVVNNLNIKLGELEVKFNNQFKAVLNAIANFQINFSPVFNRINLLEVRILNALKIFTNLESNIKLAIKAEIKILSALIANLNVLISAQFNAVLAAIAKINLTAINAALKIVDTNIKAIIGVVNALTISNNNILAIAARIETKFTLSFNLILNKLRESLDFNISPEIGDCVAVETASASGNDDSQEKEYKIVATQNYNKIGSTFLGLFNRLNSIQEDICEIEQPENDCMVLLPDPRSYYDAGKFLVFSWVLESDPRAHIYQAHSQLRNPIAALQATPDPNINYWDIYFADKYKILGQQWGNYWSNDSKIEPLIKGWFLNETEAKRFFISMRSLTTSTVLNTNNPRFPRIENNTMDIKNAGEKLVLKKVCYAEKNSNTNKLNKLHSWQNPYL